VNGVNGIHGANGANVPRRDGANGAHGANGANGANGVHLAGAANGSAAAISTAAPTAANGAAKAKEKSGGELSRDKLTDMLLSIVEEKTGYPRDMVGLDQSLESDLGIDSIKRIEVRRRDAAGAAGAIPGSLECESKQAQHPGDARRHAEHDERRRSRRSRLAPF
jgi:hypothetical protein